MKKYIFALLLSFMPLAQADFVSALKLKEWLDTPAKRDIALAYIAGSTDFGQDIFYCLPGGINIKNLSNIIDGELSALTIKNLKQLAASEIIITTLIPMFPCKEDKPAKPAGRPA